MPRKPTSSPGSASGLTLSAPPGGPTIDPSGLDHLRVSHSAQPGEGGGSEMPATSGPSGSGSSRSADLQSSLESRLRTRPASAGSTLYTLTWKTRVTPSGLPIYALRASVLRTSGNACTSSPSPTCNRATYTRRNGNPNEVCLTLPGAVQLTSWPTTAARDWKSTASNKHGDNARPLNEVAALASWATPAAREAGGTPEQLLARKTRAIENGAQLGVSLTSLALQVKLVDSGETPTGLPAETTRRGQLNPDHSRWLMGIPAAWAECAPLALPRSTATATPSARRSRRSSSAR